MSSNREDPVADRTPKKAPGTASLHVVVTPPSADSLPDPPPTCQSLHRNVVQFTRAITPSALPVTDEVRDRIYRDWMRGVPMVDLAVVYRDPVAGKPRMAELETLLRNKVRRERDEFLVRLHQQNAQLQRRAA